METQITELLQGLERTLERLVAEIRSQFDVANPHLSLAEWRAIAELMLAERQELTANPAFKRVDIYVPLALVERRQVKEGKLGQRLDNREQWEREEETMTPIAEDAFFYSGFAAGEKSEKSGPTDCGDWGTGVRKNHAVTGDRRLDIGPTSRHPDLD